MTKEEILDYCKIEEHTVQTLSEHFGPMCVGPKIPDDMENGFKYKCWVYYDDGWGCTYVSLIKYEKIEN